jgi:hypothetical protein
VVPATATGTAIESLETIGEVSVSVWSAWTWSTIALASGVVVGLTVVTVVAIFLLEAQRRRDRTAAVFQDRLAAPIARELGYTGVSVLPTVRIPIVSAATRPAVIRLEGQVPSYDLRDRVVRLVEREAMRLRYFRIEDHIRVAPPADQRGRRLA